MCAARYLYDGNIAAVSWYLDVGVAFTRPVLLKIRWCVLGFLLFHQQTSSQREMEPKKKHLSGKKAPMLFRAVVAMMMIRNFF